MLVPVTSTIAIHALNIRIISPNCEFSYWTKRETWIVSIGIIMNLKHESFKSVVRIFCENGYILRPKIEDVDELKIILYIDFRYKFNDNIQNRLHKPVKKYEVQLHWSCKSKFIDISTITFGKCSMTTTVRCHWSTYLFRSTAWITMYFANNYRQ